MIPRQGRVAVRQTAQRPPQPQYKAYSFPGPSLGWVSDQNLAISQPGAAYVLENVFPTATGGIMRRGCANQADISGEAVVTDPAIRSMFAYESGGLEQLFAAADGGIFDVTIQNSPVLEYELSSSRISTAQYTSTDGIRFVRGVNGADEAWVYDGATFGTTPALTFAAPDAANTSDILDFVWVYRNRFFFIQKDSFTLWYLPVGQIGGELVRLDLGGEFRLGGKLIFGGTWSIESGDGLNSLMVVATDKGEVAVFQGSNPGDANDWLRVGVYTIGEPKGPQAFAYRGGDLLVATNMGLVMLSAALQKDAITVALTALSAPIENEWRQAVQQRSGDWQVAVWSAHQMLAIALPTGSQQDRLWLVANARTNKWAAFTGWDATSLQVFNDRLFFGTPDGIVYEANTTGSDDGVPYTATYVPVFDQLGVPGVKAVHMARAVMRSSPRTIEQLSVHADFRLRLPNAPDASPTQAQNQWGVGQWGSAIWGGNNEQDVQDVWRNMFGEGEAITIAHQVTSGGAAPLDTEFIRTDVLFTVGEMQT